jgi:hypothetical protein
VTAGQLEGGIAAQMIEVVGIFVAEGDGQDARAQNVRQRMNNRPGSRRSVTSAASLSAMPIRRSANANSITPPSELMRPPSNAAVSFLRSTDGSENGSRLLSIMAGVAASDSARGWL